MIYRDVLASSSVFEERFASVELFGPQSPITRVNKQIRAEALHIYYTETSFFLEVGFRINYCHFRGSKTENERNFLTPFSGCVNFCRAMEAIDSAQRQTPEHPDPLGYVRNLRVQLFVGKPNRLDFTLAEFHKVDEMQNLERCGSGVEVDETSWADLEMVDALVKAWMERGPHRRPSSNQQDRLVNALWLFGVHFRSDPESWITFSKYD